MYKKYQRISLSDVLSEKGLLQYEMNLWKWIKANTENIYHI